MRVDDAFPEMEPIRRGDPFVALLSKYDDIVIDIINDATFGEMDDSEAEALIRDVERERDDWEIETLERWVRR